MIRTSDMNDVSIQWHPEGFHIGGLFVGTEGVAFETKIIHEFLFQLNLHETLLFNVNWNEVICWHFTPIEKMQLGK